MSSSIKIDIEEFRRTSELFRRAADSSKTQGNRIKALTSDLLEGWIGESKEAFRNKYEEIKKEMYSYDDMLIEISDDLIKIADSFEKADNRIAKKMIHDK